MTYVIGTAGHVDHGKSTLVEALTGIDPDRLAEEKAREMTIDLGFAWLTLPGGETVGIVDVPGHRDFIENMLAGVGGIDLALLVIAADEGVMPQTREHLAILDLLEVPGGVVALTKTDMVSDPDWLELVMLDVSDILSGTTLAGAPIVPVSARTGDGLDELIETLATALRERPPQPDRGRPRLPVDRVFTMSGFGTIVTGTLTGGSFVPGDEVEIVPRGLRARIRGLQSHRETIDSASPGSRVAMNLGGVDKDEVQRGDVIAPPGLLRGSTLVDVEFRYLEDAGRPLKHNSEVKFFSGAAETLAYVRLVGDRELPPGAAGWLQLRLTDELALDKGDRFILRYPSPPRTIGGGVILDPHPPHRWRRYKPEVVERFETLAAGSPDELVLHTLEGQPALQPGEVAGLVGLPENEVAESIDRLAAQGDVWEIRGGWWVARASWARTADRIMREVGGYHAQFPLRAGMPREALRSKLRSEGKLFTALMEWAVQAGVLVDEGTSVRLPGHQVTFSGQQQAAIDRLLDQMRANPLATPSVKEAVEQVGEEVFLALVEREEIVQVSEEVIFDPETFRRLVDEVEGYIQQNGSITVAQARDLFGSSRKYVLALLEYLDGSGVTRRVDDARVLRRSG